MVLPLLSLEVAAPESTSNSSRLSSLCKKVRLTFAALRRMQLTLHANCRTPHGRFALGAGDVCLVGETRRAPSGIVGMRGTMVIRLRPYIIVSTPPPAPQLRYNALNFCSEKS